MYHMKHKKITIKIMIIMYVRIDNTVYANNIKNQSVKVTIKDPKLVRK